MLSAISLGLGLADDHQDNDDCECDGGGGRQSSVVSARDPASFLEAAGHDLDPAAAPVAALVVTDGLVVGFLAWDAGLDTLACRVPSESVGVGAAITD